MTLAQLKEQILAINPQGVSETLLTNKKLEVLQYMAFGCLLPLCEPLNLVVSYQDSGIYKVLEDGWFLKKPTIATEENHHIDIDDRLDMAFAYIIVSFLAIKNGGEKRFEASRLVLEYSINVNDMGYSKAKEVYEQNSFITKVKFDCFGKFYEVDEDFIKLIIDCILCKGVCMRADENAELELYKQYLQGEAQPLDKEKLTALDNGVFNYLIQNIELVASYTTEELSSVTTRFNELCKLGEGETVDKSVEDLNKRVLNKSCCEIKVSGCKDEH